MCGVAGFYATGDPLPISMATRMVDALRHRGPDGVGVYGMPIGDARGEGSTARVAIAHARLRLEGGIEAGAQPLSSRSGNCVASVNGEIYNHRDLWKKHFPDVAARPDWSDCLIVAELYELLGPAALSELEGIFAGVIFDSARCEMIMFRDHFGTKPLYYSRSSKAVFVCSEIRPILRATAAEVKLCEQGLVELLRFQSPLGERTLFDGVASVLPGTALIVSRAGIHRRSIPAPWRGSSSQLDEDLGRSSLALREALESAVRRQWHPDAGAFLSSGIDSNGIVGSLVRQGRVLPTYTAKFSDTGLLEYDEGCDESEVASSLARGYGVRHSNVHVTSEQLVLNLRSIVQSLEDLRGPMALGSWCIAEMASSECRVLFSGMGADEILGGYTDRFPSPDGGDVAVHAVDFERRMARRMVHAEEWPLALAGHLGSEGFAFGIMDVLPELSSAASLASPDALSGSMSLLLDQAIFLPALLHVEDRMCMAHGIEARVPYLDPLVLRAVRRVPRGLMLSNGLGKYALRVALQTVVPELVLTRSKQPFRVPEATWYARDLRGWVADLLLGDRSRMGEIFNRSWLSVVLETQGDGTGNRRHLIWTLICLAMWMDIFL